MHSTWDFWDPFVPPSSRSGTEEQWEATTTESEVDVMAAGGSGVTAPPSVVSGFYKDTTVISSELAVVVSRNAKDLVEIIKELDEYFFRAAEAGADVSLERCINYGRNLSQWSSNSKLNGFVKLGGMVAGGLPM
ncbi:hypothetical protein Ancab_026616 [Ancistrocladus abbreviatus]